MSNKALSRPLRKNQDSNWNKNFKSFEEFALNDRYSEPSLSG